MYVGSYTMSSYMHGYYNYTMSNVCLISSERCNMETYISSFWCKCLKVKFAVSASIVVYSMVAYFFLFMAYY